MKPVRAFIATILFFFVLLSIYLAHVTFFRVNVVLYHSVLDGILAAVISGAALFGLRYFNCFNHFERFQLVSIWLLVGYALAISIPTVID